MEDLAELMAEQAQAGVTDPAEAVANIIAAALAAKS